MPQELAPPEACGSMTELRAAIDVLDGRLVEMLALRQAYIERAANLKSERGAVRDAARVEQVVRNVVGEAMKAGLSPAIAEAVWRALIEASIAHEYDAFDAKGSTKPT
jgi:isochorismate pyruvate lyase